MSFICAIVTEYLQYMTASSYVNLSFHPIITVIISSLILDFNIYISPIVKATILALGQILHPSYFRWPKNFILLINSFHLIRSSYPNNVSG